MSIPIRDCISGSPAGGQPHITTLGSTRTRRTRPKWLVAVASGGPAPPRGSLWEAERRWAGETVDVYRTRQRPPDGFAGRVHALPWQPLPVTAEEMSAARDEWATVSDDELMDHARMRRGEPVEPEAGRLSAAPIEHSMEAADEAAIAYVRTDHLYRGVREEHGRWQGYVGLGGMLSIVCTCDTREEALTVATAHLWRRWIDRVEEILRLRGGDLSWGWDIPSPVLEDEKPQASY